MAAGDTKSGGLRPTRRTVVKGAAWAMPAVVVASAAPAHAASETPIIDWDQSEGCKLPGSSWGDYCYANGYVLWGEFVNPFAQMMTVTITGITVGGAERCIVGLADTDVNCNAPLNTMTFQIPGNGTRSIAVYTNTSNSAASTNLTVFFNYAVGAQPAQPGFTSSDVGGSPWQGSCRHPCADGLPMSACGTDCAAT